jgi:sensor c-di-GMP phosphodiesterase-like protein
MQMRLPSFASLTIAAASAIVFVIGGHFAANTLIDAQRSKQLHELGDVALRKSEAAVDYAAAALDELARRGPISCESASLQVFRLHVYQHPSVKDIRVISRDGLVLCSAYSETLEFDKGWVSRNDMLPGRDQALRIFRVDQFFGVALGVLKDIDEKNSLVTILGINESLFDIMPPKLRDHSEVVLELGEGQQIVQSGPLSAANSSSDIVNIVTESSQYPLRTIIRVEQNALNGWDREPYFPILFLSVALGLVFGVLLGKAAARSGSPVAEIDKALAADEFKPFLQPIFDLRTGEILGCEALARWVRRDGTVLPPSKFIPLAEASGRIEPITWQILSSALNGLLPVLRRDRHFKVSVNVVPHHILAFDFIEVLKKTVTAARVSPRQVVLELTEREEVVDLSPAAEVVAKLRDLGYKVAIDDVGIGHSGLSHIQKLGANILKIDKFFVDSIGRDSAATAIVEMLVRLAHELKMSVLAEGIEDKMQLEALIACGVEQGQGFLVSQPLPVIQFIDFLDRHRPWSTADQNQRLVEVA